MKVLLDENPAQRLRRHLGVHEAFTVEFLGWKGLKNGELLRTAEQNGIEVFLTGDQALTLEQNLRGRRIAVAVLSAVEWKILRPAVDGIIGAIDRAEPGSVQIVDCGTFTR